jgi:hypothetical protein
MLENLKKNKINELVLATFTDQQIDEENSAQLCTANQEAMLWSQCRRFLPIFGEKLLFSH